jgi:hypothetical protein
MAADSAATKEAEERPVVPVDDSSEVEDVVEDLVDEEEDDDIDEELLDLAATFGVNPDEFDDPSELEKEVYRVSSEQQQVEPAAKPEAKATPEELALEAYNLNLDAEHIDEKLIAELQNFSKTQTQRFAKALNELQAKHRDEIGVLEAQIQHLAGIANAQVQQSDLRLADRWISKNEEAQGYYGEGKYDDFDGGSRPARRRRSLVSRANQIANVYRQQNPQKRPPSPKTLLDMAFAATPRKGKGKDKPPKKKTPTKAARVAGSGSAQRGTKNLSEHEQLEEAGAKVAEWQRQHGF